LAISALSGRIIEAWGDWTPTFGEHTVTATLSDVKLHKIGECTENVGAKSTVAEDVIIVDIDTDDDGIGNIEDTDDDNDGISDEDEIEACTYPLTFTKTSENKEETGEEREEDNDESSADIEEAWALALYVPREGPEKFLDGETVENLLSNVTKKVNKSKVSLDSYREDRNEAAESGKPSSSSTGADHGD